MRTIDRLGLFFALAALALALLAACSAAPADARIGVHAPDRTQFDAVGLYLVHRCGSLDCHGSAYRNLRIYGRDGLRLDPKDIPGGRRSTTSAELDATYRSVVGLEPVVMSAVVEGGPPGLLTFVRKARGTESHKGNALIVPGDDQDKCITTWLAGKVDTAACGRATANTL